MQDHQIALPTDEALQTFRKTPFLQNRATIVRQRPTLGLVEAGCCTPRNPGRKMCDMDAGKVFMSRSSGTFVFEGKKINIGVYGEDRNIIFDTIIDGTRISLTAIEVMGFKSLRGDGSRFFKIRESLHWALRQEFVAWSESFPDLEANIENLANFNGLFLRSRNRNLQAIFRASGSGRETSLTLITLLGDETPFAKPGTSVKLKWVRSGHSDGLTPNQNRLLERLRQIL